MNGLQATTDDLIAYDHVGSILRAWLSPYLCAQAEYFIWNW